VPGEDPVAGLKREIDEEFGVEVEVGDPFYVFTYTNNIKRSHSIEVIYFAKFVSELGSLAVNPEDHSEYGWFAENELVHATTEGKGLDDIEFQAMKKGFALLRGRPPQF
jgi:ADP-ribose pyrophosphatase YjhB (NUDIX family)